MDRVQPVVIGLDPKGELIWGIIPMPQWQMLMFPLRYFGDFAAFWMRKQLFEHTGIEVDSDSSSMTLRSTPWKKKHRTRSGD